MRTKTDAVAPSKPSNAEQAAPSLDANKAMLRALAEFSEGDADEQADTLEALVAGLEETRRRERQNAA